MPGLLEELEMEDVEDLDGPEDEARAAPSEELAPEKEPEEPKRETMVPHGALHEERERRKQLDQQNSELRRQMEEQNALVAKMEERFNAFVAQRDEPKIPDYDENPAEHLRAQLESTRKELEALKQGHQKVEQENMSTRQMQNFVQHVSAAEQAFSKAHQDYYDAAEFLKGARAAEYAAMGFNEVETHNLVLQEAQSVAADAVRRGRDPAEVFYNLAKIRGFANGSKAGTPSQTPNLRQIEQNMQSAGSLGPSGSGDGELTLQKLAQMDDDEFAKATEGANWRKLGKRMFG